jgi:hypothetical protein
MRCARSTRCTFCAFLQNSLYGNYLDFAALMLITARIYIYHLPSLSISSGDVSSFSQSHLGCFKDGLDGDFHDCCRANPRLFSPSSISSHLFRPVRLLLLEEAEFDGKIRFGAH